MGSTRRGYRLRGEDSQGFGSFSGCQGEFPGDIVDPEGPGDSEDERAKNSRTKVCADWVSEC